MMLSCPIDFQGHRSNFKVAEVESFVNFDLISPFPDDILKTPAWISL